MRKPAAGALKQGATFQNLRDAVALQRLTGRFFPGIGQKRRAIKLSHGSGDARLQPLQIRADTLRCSGCAAHAAAPLTAR